MQDIPLYKQFNEGFAYTGDPFKRGDTIWAKKIHIDGIAVTVIEASITGIDQNHTAIISIYTKSLDTFGEDLAGTERFIIHQKDFNNREEASEHLKNLEKKTTYK